MNSRILLVEPAYKTRYPPLGLMKIATYHNMKGDEVKFVKGCDKNVRYEYWDRIYISTLFTWTWAETIKTIKFYHSTLFDFASKCYVGGVLASLMPKEIYNETGIQPVQGLLDNPNKINQDDDIIIDRLPPDYNILKDVENTDFKYSLTDAYLGYTTRGCVRKCEFCAVRSFEPRFISYIDMKDTVMKIDENSGPKQNLVLMDNNVLASSKFDQIIDDICSLGFHKGAKFGPTKKRRIVDFNQGLDAEFLTEKKMKKLTTIPIEPMRIAFDSIEDKDDYVKAVRLAHKYGQKNMSNYILYNFLDTPEDFYERLRINVDLNEEFRQDRDVNTAIYSFPMRYIPLDAKARDVDTGNRNWNPRYLRGVQVILSVMKGCVMPGFEFFLQAFGRNAEEFKAILLMPDEFIRNRLIHLWRSKPNYDDRLKPYVKEWMTYYFGLADEERDLLIQMLASNSKDKMWQQIGYIDNKTIRNLVKCHLEQDAIVAKYKTT